MQMAAAPSWLSSSLPSQLLVVNSGVRNRSSASAATSQVNKATCSADASLREKDCLGRRQILVGLAVLTTSSLCRGGTALAEEEPENYRAFVDKRDGYQYLYPSDWRDFDYLGHDSAFKDRFAALQHVRLSFIPTVKKDVHDLGSMEEVVFDLVKNTYAAPDQIATIYGMEERTIDGKNYWTFEYELAARSFSRSSFATIGIGNGRFYTLVVGANERRWSRLRNKLKVVADSFKILDIRSQES